MPVSACLISKSLNACVYLRFWNRIFFKSDQFLVEVLVPKYKYLHLCAPVCACMHLCVPAFSCVHLHMPWKACMRLCMPWKACVRLRTPACTCVNLYILCLLTSVFNYSVTSLEMVPWLHHCFGMYRINFKNRASSKYAAKWWYNLFEDNVVDKL